MEASALESVHRIVLDSRLKQLGLRHRGSKLRLNVNARFLRGGVCRSHQFVVDALRFCVHMLSGHEWHRTRVQLIPASIIRGSSKAVLLIRVARSEARVLRTRTLTRKPKPAPSRALCLHNTAQLVAKQRNKAARNLG